MEGIIFRKTYLYKLSESYHPSQSQSALDKKNNNNTENINLNRLLKSIKGLSSFVHSIKLLIYRKHYYYLQTYHYWI